MKKRILIGGLAILVSSSAFARFSEFVRLTPTNEPRHGISVAVTGIKDTHVLIRFKWDRKDKKCWLITFKDEQSVPETLNFRQIIWRRQREVPPDVLQLIPLPSNSDGFVETIVEQSTIDRTFIAIDFPRPIMDGGYYYTIDLPEYVKRIEVGKDATKSEPVLPTLTEVVAEKGVCTFSDGASFYQFKKGGSFRLGPLGLCGKTIDGTWSTDDGRTYVIVGQRAAVNGVWRSDDYRKVTLSVTLQAAQPEAEPAGLYQFEVYPVQFQVIQEEKLTKEEYEAAARQGNERATESKQSGPQETSALIPASEHRTGTKEDLATAYIAALKTGSMADLWSLVHPGVFSKLDDSGRKLIENTWKGRMDLTIDESADRHFKELDADVDLSFGGSVHEYVPITHTFQIAGERKDGVGSLALVYVNGDKGKWSIVPLVPKP